MACAVRLWLCCSSDVMCCDVMCYDVIRSDRGVRDVTWGIVAWFELWVSCHCDVMSRQLIWCSAIVCCHGMWCDVVSHAVVWSRRIDTIKRKMFGILPVTKNDWTSLMEPVSWSSVNALPRIETGISFIASTYVVKTFLCIAAVWNRQGTMKAEGAFWLPAARVRILDGAVQSAATTRKRQFHVHEK